MRMFKLGDWCHPLTVLRFIGYALSDDEDDKVLPSSAWLHLRYDIGWKSSRMTICRILMRTLMKVSNLNACRSILSSSLAKNSPQIFWVIWHTIYEVVPYWKLIGSFLPNCGQILNEVGHIENMLTCDHVMADITTLLATKARWSSHHI